MAKILFYMAPTRGSLYPMVPVLQQLVEQGHELRAVVPECEIKQLNRNGIPAFPIDAAIECAEHSDHAEPSHAEALQRALLCRIERGKLEAEDLALNARELEPDMLIVDGHSFGAAAWAEGSGIPWASWSTRLLPFPANNIPPFSLGLPLKQGAFSALKNLGKKGTIQRIYDSVLYQLNDLRASQGAMPLNTVLDWPAHLHTLLYFTAEPFEYKRDWPDNVRLVGPGTFDPFPETVKLADDDRPVILVSCCCDFLNETAMVKAVLEGLDPDKYQIIVTTAAVDPDQFNADPRVQIVRFSSHSAILKRAAAVICPGSLGLVQRSLCSGVPVLCVTHCRDQIEIGQRVKHLKAGTALHVTQASGSSVREALETAMACQPEAQAVAEIFREFDSAKAAANIINYFISEL